MSRLIKFYRDELTVNNNYFSDLIYNWSDYQFETDVDWITWLFPSYSKNKYNKNNPVLTDNVVKIFQRDKNIRLSVLRSTLRLLLLYGFTIENSTIVQVRPVRRYYNGRPIGFYSIHNYRYITQILKFLELINMSNLSSLFFLAMTMAIKHDRELREIVKKENSFYYWMNTQSYLSPYVNSYTFDMLDN